MSHCRMISDMVMTENAYLNLPLNAQALYVQLMLNADDEGFVENTKRVLKMVGVSKKVLKPLLQKGYIIYFEQSDVSVISHWYRHNRMYKYRPTSCFQEKKALCLVDNCYILSTEVVDNLSGN